MGCELCVKLNVRENRRGQSRNTWNIGHRRNNEDKKNTQHRNLKIRARRTP